MPDQAAPPGSPDATLGGRTLNAFVGARFLGLLADQTSTFMLPVAVFAATHDVSLAGLAFTVQWLPRVLGMPVLGLLVDRFPARRQFVTVDMARAVVLLGLTLRADPAWLIAASGALTLLNGHATIATEGVLARGVPGPRMQEAQSKQQASQQLALVAGPALGGWLLAALGVSGGVVVVALVLLAAAAATAVIASGQPAPEVRAADRGLGALGRRLADGARESWHNRPLLVLMLMTVAVNLVGGLALAALPTIVIGAFDGSQGTVGAIAGAASLASLAAAAIVNVLARRVEIGTMVRFAFAVLALAALGLALSPSMVLFGVAYGGWMASMAVFVIWMRTRRLQLIPSGQVGSVLGFFVSAILAATPIAGLVLTVFGGWVAPQRLLLALAILSAVLLVPLATAWRRQVSALPARLGGADVSGPGEDGG